MQITHRKTPSIFIQVVDLFLMEMTNWRWSWRSMLLTATLTPIFGLLSIGIFARDSGLQTLVYVFTGNIILSLMFGNMGNVESRFCFMRFGGGLDYYASLPVRRYALILAVVLSFLLLSIPSLIVTVAFGAFFLRVPVHPHPLLLAVVPLCAVPLSGVGALVGTWARTPQEAGAINLILTMVMAGLGPVVIPPERLPRLFLWLGYLSPATYAASALRQTLIGPLSSRLALDLIALVVLSILVFGLVGRLMAWRQN